MLNVRQVASLIEVTPVRIKQILKEKPSLKHERGEGTYGVIRIPNSTVRYILNSKQKTFRKTIATIGMEKGGVGKSLLTCNVAINLSLNGCRVLIVDLDPEASATNLLIPENADFTNLKSIYEVFKHDLPLKKIIAKTRYEGLDIVPCRGKARRVDRLVSDLNPKNLLKDKMEGLDKYDLIMFEIPPTFSKIISSAYLTSDLVVMPTFPDAWSIESIQLTIDDITEDAKTFEASTPEIRVLMNKFNPSRTASKEAWEQLINTYKNLVLPFQIKDSADLQNSVNNGLSVFETKCMREVREIIKTLADFICPIISVDEQKMQNITQ